MMEPSSAHEFGGISKQTQWGTGTERATSRIGPTVRIKGEVTAEEDLLILGSVEGVIEHDHTLTIHAQGAVKAEIKAREVFIEGSVEGNVYGTSRVRIEECGVLTGNVLAPRIGVVEGASLKGSVEMESDPAVIEQRFCESAGRKPATDRKSKKNAVKDTDELESLAAKTTNSGEPDAAQAAEQRESDAETGAEPGDGAKV